MIERGRRFIEHELWKIDLTERNRLQRVVIKQLRILVIAIKGFFQNNIQEKASALTYYSLLSIVPVIAMAFGIAKGFGFETRLKEELLAQGSNNKEVWDQVLNFADSMLANTQGGLVAGIGVMILLWSVMKLLSSIESSFNDIWEIRKGRSIARKFADYLAIMLIAPILLLLSGSATVFIKSQLTELTEQFALIGFFGPVLNFLFRLSPYVLIWLVFTLIYAIMPNTRVTFRSAVTAGIIAGTGFQLFEWLYITLQIGVTRYNAIYGSFAALPLFLIWLQTSWLIVLVGAEMSFANQNVEQYENESEADAISIRFTRHMTILVIQKIAQRFSEGATPYTSEELSEQLGVPVRLIRNVIHQLSEAGLLAETPTDDEKTVAYIPARDIHTIRMLDVVDAIENEGAERIPSKSEADFQVIKARFNNLHGMLSTADANVLITDL